MATLEQHEHAQTLAHCKWHGSEQPNGGVAACIVNALFGVQQAICPFCDYARSIARRRRGVA